MSDEIDRMNESEIDREIFVLLFGIEPDKALGARVAPDGTIYRGNMDMADERKWSPSTDMAAAWQVVEKMGADGWMFNLIGRAYGCGWTVHLEHFAPEDDKPTFGAGCDLPAPLAICRAALRAVRARPGGKS